MDAGSSFRQCRAPVDNAAYPLPSHLGAETRKELFVSFRRTYRALFNASRPARCIQSHLDRQRQALPLISRRVDGRPYMIDTRYRSVLDTDTPCPHVSQRIDTLSKHGSMQVVMSMLTNRFCTRSGRAPRCVLFAESPLCNALLRVSIAYRYGINSLRYARIRALSN